MNLSHLRYIAEVAKTGSITKAAQNLYMGQPNLSKAIREMEKSMGTAIFKRTSKGVEPTEKGKEIVERARALLNAAEDFERDFCNKKDRAENITVGICGSEYCVGILEDLAAKWAGENLSFEYFRLDLSELTERVKEGGLSFGINRVFTDRDEVFFERLGVKGQILAEGKPMTVINRESPLREKEKISFYSDLAEMVQVVLSGQGIPKEKTCIAVSDIASGERIIEKNPKCFMLVSSLDISGRGLGSDKLLYKETFLTAQGVAPAVFKDTLVYAEGKSFSEREKEIIEKCSFIQS